jgi:nucleotide-binding universal stress UspA family protein
MYKRIIVPLDGSAAAECVIDHVRSVAATGSEVILVQIVAKPALDFVVPEPTLSACLDDEFTQEARVYLSAVAAKLKMRGVTVTTCVLAEQGPTGSLIVDFIRKAEGDLVVVSAHGRTGILGRLLGSVAEKIVHHAGVPVLIAHPDPRHAR